MIAENLGVFYGNRGSFQFSIVVRDWEHRIVLRADSSSIHPYAGYDERGTIMRLFANRLVEAINKGGV